MNGKSAGADVDFFAGKPVSTEPIKLGASDPVNGVYLLRVKVVGQNSKSKGTFFGLDCVVLHANK